MGFGDGSSSGSWGAGMALRLASLFRYFAVIGLFKTVHKIAHMASRDG